jgi:regulator of PEP synthase PpsR (kinase-PPPase family)
MNTELQHAFIVSDGTGTTAIQALKSALAQFEFVKVEKHMRPQVREEEQILEILNEAQLVNGFVIHTLVSKELRDFILEQGRFYAVRTIDLMGPLLARLSNQFEVFPTERPGIFKNLSEAYFQRIEAIEYSLRHDDGQRIKGLVDADIVLLGVSRTFKTPLSVYMGHKGWRVANIPVILNVPLPQMVFKVPPEKVFCLHTYPERLSVLREVRTRRLGGFTGNYHELSNVQKELNYALKLYRLHPKWTVINVTHKPIEEISTEILRKLRRSKSAPKKD